MKKTSTSLLLLAALALLPGCSEGDVKASELIESGKKAVQDLNLDELGVDGMVAKVGDLGDSLKSKLEGIQDKAGAIDVAETMGPVVEQLNKLKKALGDKMPTIEGLNGVVTNLKDKFSGDESVMKVLQPLLDKLKNLMA